MTPQEAFEVYSFNNKFRRVTKDRIRKITLEREAMSLLRFIPWEYFQPNKDQTKWSNEPATTIYGDTVAELQQL